MRWLDSVTDGVYVSGERDNHYTTETTTMEYMWIWAKSWEIVEDRGAWHAIVHGIAKNWT